MFQNKLVEALPTIILVGVVTLACAWGYTKIKQSGFREGAASVQVKWDRDRKEYEEALTIVKDHYAKAEEVHRTENRRISNELSQVESMHKVELANAVADLQRRLLTSTSRSKIYQRQAEGGTLECRSLASHASRLDTALEEGRALEQEYRSTLGLRDRQVKLLSDQILNDRELMK